MSEIIGYTPAQAFEVRVKAATDALCKFDPDAAAYRQRTEAWVRLVLSGDDRRELKNNPQYALVDRLLRRLRRESMAMHVCVVCGHDLLANGTGHDLDCELDALVNGRQS